MTDASKRTAKVLLTSLQIVFYIFLLVIWFKNFLPPFKSLRIPVLFPLAALILISTAKSTLFRSERLWRRPRIRVDTAWWGLIAVLALTVLIRLPYLAHDKALMIADDGVSTLMGKHLAEGEPASIYFYGDVHEGAFSQHIFALFFLIFGYSVLTAKLVMLGFWLAFLALHFYWLRRFFSPEFGLCVVLFYAFPIGNLVILSLDTLNSFPVLFFFGGLMFGLTALIVYEDRLRWIPTLAFISGIIFWDHQITVYFIAASVLLLLAKFRTRMLRYLEYGLFFVLGAAPFILFELCNGFLNLKWLFLEERGGEVPGSRILRMITFFTNCLSHESHVLDFVYLGLLLLGGGAVVFMVVGKPQLKPRLIYVLFFVTSIGIYLLSHFSQTEWIRYVYPLYFVFPVLLLAGFELIPSRWRVVPMVLLILAVFGLSNGRGARDNLALVKEASGNLDRLVDTMTGTGRVHWVGEYWSAFLIDALSEESVRAYPSDFPPYYPYKLEYFNTGHNSHYVYVNEIGSYALRFKEYLDGVRQWRSEDLADALNLKRLVERLDVPARVEQVGGSLLIHDVAGDIFVQTPKARVPETLPRLEVLRMSCSRGHCLVVFRNTVPEADEGFRLWLEIPGYSSLLRPFSSKRPEVQFRIPHPDLDAFELEYFLEYRGLHLSRGRETARHVLTEEERGEARERLIFLSGTGPVLDIGSGSGRLLEKEVRIEVNADLRTRPRIRLDLLSPFPFSDPNWFGDHTQHVRVKVNGETIGGSDLEEGRTIVRMDLSSAPLEPTENLVTLTFRYHLPFEFAPLWKTAALLMSLDFD